MRYSVYGSFCAGGYIKLVSVELNGEGVRRRRAFGAERKELFSAATYACALRGEEQISAVWANIEPKLFNISAACGFFLKVAAQYCFCIERKRLRKGGNKENIGCPQPRSHLLAALSVTPIFSPSSL